VRKLRSFRGQALLAGLLLLVILGGMAGVAVWRVQSDRDVRGTLESRATTVAALNDARADFFLNINLLIAGALGGDPVPFAEEYRLRRPMVAGSIAAAQTELAALNEPEQAAALGTIGDEIEAMQQEMDAGMEIALGVDQETVTRMAGDYTRALWPRYESIMEGLEQLAEEQQAKLAVDRAAADDASDTSLRLLVGLGALAFLVASAILTAFVLTLLGSLASLKASARAITSGNLEARADVSGPEETASLARDFNEMTETLVERSAQLQDSEGRFRNVLEVSRDLIYKLNLQTHTFDYASPSSLRLTGFTFEELAEMGLRRTDSRVHPEDRKQYKVSPNKLPSPTSDHGTASIIEYRWKCKDGEYRWFSDNRALVRDEHGRPLATVGTVRDITERKQAESALRESEEQFRTLSASAPIGIFQTDTEARFTYVNEHLLGIHGVQLEELMGQVWTKRIHPDDYRATADEALKAGMEKRAFSGEYRILRPQGEVRWIRVVSSPVLSRDGSLVSYVGAAEDVTERREAEVALRESEERFRSLSASAPIGIFLTDAQGKTVYANEHLLSLGGRSFEEGTEHKWTQFIHPEDRDAVFTEIARAAAENRDFSQEYRLLTKAGEEIWVHGTATTIRTPEGIITGHVGTIEDITERRKADAALRDSEQKFRTLSALAPIGIFQTDAQGRFTYANEHLLGIHGMRLEELLGQVWTKRIHPDDRRATVEEALKAGKELRTFSGEYRILRPQGEIRWIRAVSSPVLSRDGSLVNFVGATEDVTERRQAEAALRESEERFRSLSAAAPVGIFLQDDKGNIVYTNERLQGITGAPSPGKQRAELAANMHPDDRERVIAGWLKAEAEHAAELSQEFRVLTPQGETRWVRVHACPIFSADGSPSSVVGTVEDITEQIQAAEAMANRLQIESAIARASNLLAGPEDADAALSLALSILGEGFGAERGAIFVARGKGEADGVAKWHAPGAADVDIRQGVDLAQFPWLVEKMLQAEPVIIPDVSEMPPEAAAEKKAWQSIGNRSMVIMSLISNGRSIGCVIFDNTDHTRDWAEEDVRLLRLAAESIASFVERQRTAEEKRKAYERIVLILATAAEARDPYTEHHLHRIRGYAEAIATEMGLPPDEIREIGLCSLLHDLGKMRVPDSILTKPGPLSEEEWEVMKNHPVWGEELLATHQWMKTARQIARWHHERWDGSGYPDGLRGEQIPVSAAIVTVADGLDAMTSERPYKGAWPPQRAIQEIRSQKGKQYSPEVVEAFNRALRKGAIKRVAVEAIHLSELSRAA
jgi:PAS domain S-box-containing protein